MKAVGQVMIQLNHSKQIENWLKGTGWKKSSTNPNIFRNDKLEALYVYPNMVRYWEDVRSRRGDRVHDVPKTKEELFEIIANRDSQ
jgi:hypothetical protein